MKKFFFFNLITFLLINSLNEHDDTIIPVQLVFQHNYVPEFLIITTNILRT